MDSGTASGCSRTRRLTRTILMAVVPDLLALAVTFVAAFIVMARVDAESYPSMATFHQAQLEAGLRVTLLVGAAEAVLKVAAFVCIAPRVSFRRRDWPLLFVPFYNVVVYVTVLWRFADVSARDWPMRADEVPDGWFAAVPVAA